MDANENLGGNIVDAEPTQPTTPQAEPTQPTEPTEPTQPTEPTEPTSPASDEGDMFGKPEAYDYKNVSLPEGMKLNEEMTQEFNNLAAKYNLSQKSADELMKMAVNLTKKTQEETVEAFSQLQEQKRQAYKQMLNSDKEVGGANFQESIQIANIAYDKFFADEELRNIIAESGLNVHPKFIKSLKIIGSKMKDDNIFINDNPPAEKTSREDILFPTMS